MCKWEPNEQSSHYTLLLHAQYEVEWNEIIIIDSKLKS